MKNRTVVVTEHKGFFEPTYKYPEVVEKQKRLLGMEPRKTYEVAKRDFAKKNIKSN